MIHTVNWAIAYEAIRDSQANILGQAVDGLAKEIDARIAESGAPFISGPEVTIIVRASAETAET